MHASEVTPEVVRTANELYWGSDHSVNQIAEELDLSKGALYGIVVPETAGHGCPLCGDEVGYPNRTAKERDLLRCATCDWDGSTDETITYEGVGAPEGDPPEPRVRASREQTANENDGAAGTDLVERSPLIAPHLGFVVRGALAGAAVGLALVFWARRR